MDKIDKMDKMGEIDKKDKKHEKKTLCFSVRPQWFSVLKKNRKS